VSKFDTLTVAQILVYITVITVQLASKFCATLNSSSQPKAIKEQAWEFRHALKLFTIRYNQYLCTDLLLI